LNDEGETLNSNKPISGAHALAQGAIEAGISLVVGYPGSPATAVANSILALTSPDAVQVEWTSNEKVAIEIVYGASVGGQRALLCVKGVGLNIALDPLMALNLAGCNAGLVILVGDDPGGWGSQNEQDSRVLAMAAELPMLEPATVYDARLAMDRAFRLSEEIGLPVLVRVTRALVLAEGFPQSVEISDEPQVPGPGRPPPPPYQREFMRWVVLPVNAVPYHGRLIQRLADVQDRFEDSSLNGVAGDGPLGVIAAGFVYQKLLDLLGGSVPADLRVLRVGTFHPLPPRMVTSFLRSVTSVLALEENAPLIERAVRAIAQQAGLVVPIYGRDTDHVVPAGELFGPQIVGALDCFDGPDLGLKTQFREEETGRPMPSRDPLCDGCPYIPTFDALIQVMEQLGGREEFIVVGDPGCMVRGQLPPYEMMDVKTSLGSSIGMATGVALSQRAGDGDKHVVALSGDSSFLHTGFNGLVDAVQVGANMLVLILDNGTTALSGGQPHPASRLDARGRPRRGVDLAALARAAGADMVQVVDLDRVGNQVVRDNDLRAAIEAGIDLDGVAVVIARGECVRS
jgi:indolepyruvate ferredoxin oxidoreductase alpha subunit